VTSTRVSPVGRRRGRGIETNGASILQTKLSHREGYEARRVESQAIPLDQHIKGRHGEGESCLEIRPDSVHDLLEMADECQHREHRLHQQAALPLQTSSRFPGSSALLVMCPWLAHCGKVPG
jgi:hypothetical protein